MSTHICPAPGCEARVARSQLACRPHWYALPKPLRDSVWNAYHDYGMGSEQHDAAIDAAIEYLQERYG